MLASLSSASPLLAFAEVWKHHHLSVLWLSPASCSTPCTCWDSDSVQIQERSQCKVRLWPGQEWAGSRAMVLVRDLGCSGRSQACIYLSCFGCWWRLSPAPQPQSSLSGIWMVYLTPQQGPKQRAAPSPCLSRL